MSRIGRWTRVPDRSQLRVWAEGDDGWSARARFHDDDGGVESWDHGELVPGPVARGLRAPRLYVARVSIDFARQSTARVHGEVVKPDGSRHGQPFVSSPLVSASGTQIVTLFAITAQS